MVDAPRAWCVDLRASLTSFLNAAAVLNNCSGVFCCSLADDLNGKLVRLQRCPRNGNDPQVLPPVS